MTFGATRIVTAFFMILALPTLSIAQERAKTDGKDASGSQVQPQGNTGPINTMSGGAPAASPQGETPPGMQAAPQGSDKTVKTDESGKPEGTPKE